MLKQTTTRWDPDTHAFVNNAARRSGLSFNQYVVAAALFRATLDFAREHPESVGLMRDLYGDAGAAVFEAARRVIEAQDPLADDY